MFSYVGIVFIYWYLKSTYNIYLLMCKISGGDFSQEVSTPQNHLVSDPWLSHCLSSHTSFTYHLPAKTFTIEPLSFTLSLLLHFLICPTPLLWYYPCRGPQLLCQCVWLKRSPCRNKICEKSFLVSASSSLCSDCLCWWRRDLWFIFRFFLSWWFLASVTMFLSGCFWIKTWQFSLMNYIKSLLGF